MARLIGWTNSTGDVVPTATKANSVGFRTFSHLRYDEWQLTGTWKMIPPAKAGEKWTFDKAPNTPDPTITLTKNFYELLWPTSQSSAEVRPPVADIQQFPP
jgi:hypothetical protein